MKDLQTETLCRVVKGLSWVHIELYSVEFLLRHKDALTNIPFGSNKAHLSIGDNT